MIILLFGAHGQVGSELQRSLALLGRIKACDQEEVPFQDVDGLRALIREVGPGLIVNAAAYTAVDRAEAEPELAYRVNTQAVAVLADEARRLDVGLVHYSTDYVFDGASTLPYLENAPKRPLNIYGKSKLEGEKAIIESGCKHLLFRTSWIYSEHGTNFAKTMIRLAREREELAVVDDQVGAPTSSGLIADVTASVLKRIDNGGTTLPGVEESKVGFFSWDEITGTYHLAAKGRTSWHGFAVYLLAELKRQGVSLRVDPESVKPISTEEYPVLAKRPASSCLNTDKLVGRFGIELPDWQTGIQRLVERLIERKMV